ncbi:pol, partial [Symbiodinium necroappetens]
VGGDWRPTRMARRLRTRFSVAALKEGDDGDAADIQKKIQAIGVLILALGGRQSASADKIRFGALFLTFCGGGGRPVAAAPGYAAGACRQYRQGLERGSDFPRRAEIHHVGQDRPGLADAYGRQVVLFYEEFEDVCALANNCRGMYISDPEAVYTRIKNKHLMFGESREEREVRVDGEHQALMKGKLTEHQFEKMPPHLQEEIREDRRAEGDQGAQGCRECRGQVRQRPKLPRSLLARFALSFGIVQEGREHVTWFTPGLERCESTPMGLEKGESGRFSALGELPGDSWSLANNEPGGYQDRGRSRDLRALQNRGALARADPRRHSHWT